MEPFYYTRMTKAQQAAYHVIMQGANALADEFQIPRIESAELYDVFFQASAGSPGDFLDDRYISINTTRTLRI